MRVLERRYDLEHIFADCKDFFYEADINFLLNVVKHQSIKAYGQAFSVNVWTIYFEERYQEGLFGGGTEKAERAMRREGKRYLRHLESIKAALPSGVTMQIKENLRDDPGPNRLHLTFQIYASATAEYSKTCYAAISDGNIAHDWGATSSFINAAKEFKDRIVSSKSELIHAIKDICDKYSENIYFYKSGFQSLDCYSEWLGTTYHSLGMMDLGRMEQCYGLAWAIAELYSPNTRYFLKVVDKAVLFQKVGRTIVAPPPKYEPW